MGWSYWHPQSALSPWKGNIPGDVGVRGMSPTALLVLGCRMLSWESEQRGKRTLEGLEAVILCSFSGQSRC